MSCVIGAAFALLMAAATALGQDKQWINDRGEIEYSVDDAHGFVDRAYSTSLEVSLEELERTEDGFVTIRWILLNKGSTVVVYNPGFSERTPAAGTIAVFDAAGRYVSRLNWPPVGYLTRQTDWVKLERGQGFVGSKTIPVSPVTRRIQVIYWRWLLEPLPDPGKPFPRFQEEVLTGRGEIMRSNVIELDGEAKGTEPTGKQ